MTPEELTIELRQIDAMASQAKHKARKKYAWSNNHVSAGDIVTDHLGRVLVESISLYVPSPPCLPSCIYYGAEITLQGKPYKKESKRHVYQTNLKES